MLDLRDLSDNEDNGEEDKWRVALDEAGYDFDDVKENEPLMIPEDEFQDYAQELAEEIGAVSSGMQWPLNCIDWDAAAKELKMDYSKVEVDGITYLFRAY